MCSFASTDFCHADLGYDEFLSEFAADTDVANILKPLFPVGFEK